MLYHVSSHVTLEAGAAGVWGGRGLQLDCCFVREVRGEKAKDDWVYIARTIHASTVRNRMLLLPTQPIHRNSVDGAVRNVHSDQ